MQKKSAYLCEVHNPLVPPAASEKVAFEPIPQTLHHFVSTFETLRQEQLTPVNRTAASPNVEYKITAK